MKLQIKELLHQLAFPETKGAKKKVRSKTNEELTSRIPSSWEVVDSRFSDSQSSPTKSSFSKRKCARIANSSRSPLLTPTLYPNPTRFPKPNMVLTYNDVLGPIDYMPKFMIPFIEKNRGC